LAPKVDLTGQTFGKITVVSCLEKKMYGSSVWLCRCDCGNEIEVPIARLRPGKIESCGVSVK